MTENKLLNRYLDIIKKPFPDKGFYYDVNTAEKCVEVSDDFAIGFAEWIEKLDWEIYYNTAAKELLEIYKKEKGL